MATLVETPDVTVLIDPGVRLAPYRYDLPPHPSEEERQKASWRRIKEARKTADAPTVPHHPSDPHNPDAPSIPRRKLAYRKDGKANINRSQRERAGAFVRALKKYPQEIHVADGNSVDFGGTQLTFSAAVPHGYNDELGYVVMVRVAQGEEVFVHTGDVEGPPLKEHLGFLIDAAPTILYVDGPMTHMPEHYPESMTRRSFENLARVMRSTSLRTLLVDHHLLRDREWRAQIAPLAAAAEEHGVTVHPAAESAGKAGPPLEANRDRLYGVEPKPAAKA